MTDEADPQLSREFVESVARYAMDHTFKIFEASPRGEIEFPGNGKFFMRVGLHMNRATQAVMGAGKFIKMRDAAEWKDWDLHTLNPQNPESCIYSNGSWRPTTTKGELERKKLELEQITMQIAQAQKMQQGELVGLIDYEKALGIATQQQANPAQIAELKRIIAETRIRQRMLEATQFPTMKTKWGR